MSKSEVSFNEIVKEYIKAGQVVKVGDYTGVPLDHPFKEYGEVALVNPKTKKLVVCDAKYFVENVMPVHLDVLGQAIVVGSTVLRGSGLSGYAGFKPQKVIKLTAKRVMLGVSYYHPSDMVVIDKLLGDG